MNRKENATAFDGQLERIHSTAGTRTQTQLAEFLGIRQSSISDAKKRQSIPAEWLLKLLLLKSVNPEWVMTGQGPHLLRPAEGSEDAPLAPVYIQEVRPPEQCTAQELVNELVRRAVSGFM